VKPYAIYYIGKTTPRTLSLFLTFNSYTISALIGKLSGNHQMMTFKKICRFRQMYLTTNQVYIMDKLLDHPSFRLIYVDDDGMSLITPSDHREAILKKGYRCISHLWGNTTRWENHPIKDVSWGVDVREEKRDKLLQIFNHYKGYFWMNVFCAKIPAINR
jgi:hypothetical protein